MNITNQKLKLRIIDISYKKNLSHIGSCLTAVDIIKDIYDIKKPDEKFVLSSGHAGLALYCVIEANGGRNAEEIFDHHGVHPDFCTECGLDCSSGSLGHGLGISVGMALARPDKNTYCLISDGECAEGSIWEASRIKDELGLDNLKVFLNFNGWAAYKQLSTKYLPILKTQFMRNTNVDYLPFLNNPTPQMAHYKVMSEDEYKIACEVLNET